MRMRMGLRSALTAFFALGGVAVSVSAATPGGAGGNRAITTDIVDNGGTRGTATGASGAVVVDQSSGGILGVSTGGAFVVKHGYVAQLFEDAPSVISNVTATPNPATTAQIVTFGVQAADEDPFSITWDFGDGSGDSTNSASVTHLFNTPGVYNVKVTLVDADFLVTEATIPVTIIAAATPTDPNDIDGDGIPNGQDADADGDGFPNSVEVEAGTDPLNGALTPFGGMPAGTPLPLTLTKIGIALSFSQSGRDGISVAGIVPVSGGFSVQGKTAILDVGGVAKVFTLDAKGMSKSSTGSGKIAVKAKKGVVAAQLSKFGLKMTKGSFASALADEKLTGVSTVKNEQRSVVVSLFFNGGCYQTTRVLSYTAKAGATGKAK